MSAHKGINTANTEAARAAGWPELTGSLMQIDWANTIRANKVHELDTATGMSDTDRTWYRQVMLRETSASVWIDNRKHPWQVMLYNSLTLTERGALQAKSAARTETTK